MIDNENDGSTALSKFEHIKQAQVLERIIIDIHDRDTLTWYMNDDSAKKIEESLGISRPYLKKILNELKHLGMLLSRGRGVYIVAKKHFQSTEDPNESK